jgi:hypothetical protein
VIVWINGPFGVGKTTVAERLVHDWPGATLFDPEVLGYPGLVEDFGRPLVVPAANPFIEARFDDHRASLGDPRFAAFVATDDRDEDAVYQDVCGAIGPLPVG